MRVLVSAKWILGFAASSGLVLVLSGSAFAANGDESTTVQPAHEAAQSSDTQVQSDGASGTSTQVKVAVTQSSQTTGETTLAVAPDARAASSVPASVSASPVSLVPAAETAADPYAPMTTSDVTAAGPVQPDPANGPQALQRSLPLPIQPMMTSSRTLSVNDLAPKLPSATPAPTNSFPVPPAQPTGALGQFSAQLAGSVVKPAFILASPANLATLLTLMILLPMLMVLTLMTAFGFGTRRDGYAHAPRSDVAVATFNLLFATPFSLSYVTAARQHAAHF